MKEALVKVISILFTILLASPIAANLHPVTFIILFFLRASMPVGRDVEGKGVRNLMKAFHHPEILSKAGDSHARGRRRAASHRPSCYPFPHTRLPHALASPYLKRHKT